MTLSKAKNTTPAVPQEVLDRITKSTFENVRAYFRDSDQTHATYHKYRKGLVMLEVGFMDVSTIEAGPAANTRYIIYTNQYRKLSPSFEQYKSWTFPQRCYFKVLVTTNIKFQTMVALLEIRPEDVNFFALNEHPLEEALRQDALRRFPRVVTLLPHEELVDPYWLRRTAFPIGIDTDGKYFFSFDYSANPRMSPLYVHVPLWKRIWRLQKRIIHRLTN